MDSPSWGPASLEVRSLLGSGLSLGPGSLLGSNLSWGQVPVGVRPLLGLITRYLWLRLVVCCEFGRRLWLEEGPVVLNLGHFLSLVRMFIVTQTDCTLTLTDTFQNALLPYVLGHRVQSAHRVTDDVMPFQSLFRDNRWVLYAACEWGTKGIFMCRVSHGLYGRRTSRSLFTYYGDTWKNAYIGIAHAQDSSWDVIFGRKLRR